ncbi:PepSY domain-containing protein [Stappia stellulata]|uniref:PepSY domain-containing protein n=1 Tax=Stappia stellulata TaxID=71235 RepID=UPI001CD6378E|nr:PepSY domain-containing protein [Stappia stellulata]MCA1241365.1 PepSY domain-containing protein [Stappia stellulata]
MHTHPSFRLLKASRPALTAVVLFAMLALAQPVTAQGQCLSQPQARAAVSSGQALPLGRVAGAVGGEIVRADLCREGGRLVYVLSVLSGGRVDTRVVDAQSGRVLR